MTKTHVRYTTHLSYLVNTNALLVAAYNKNFTVVCRNQNTIYPKMMQNLSYLINSFKTKNNLGFHKNSVQECCSPE